MPHATPRLPFKRGTDNIVRAFVASLWSRLQVQGNTLVNLAESIQSSSRDAVPAAADDGGPYY